MVGDAWLRGELSVYQEHLFTESVQAVMREAIAAVESIDPSQSNRRPRVLLTTTPNEQHGLGLLMAECHFALETCPRFVLGTSTPISEIAQAVQHLDIDVVALSFSAFAAKQDVAQSLAQLRQQLPAHVEIWAGGAGMPVAKKVALSGVSVMSRPSHVALEITSWRTRHLHVT
jgi:methylmalonyl-CoA mutase cobalamin-binding subunit